MKNFLEGLVTELYEELRDRYPGACRCDLCRADVIAYALNHARPRYSGGSTVGVALTSVDLQKDATRAELAVIVIDGIQKVATNPRHGSPRASGETKRQDGD